MYYLYCTKKNPINLGENIEEQGTWNSLLTQKTSLEASNKFQVPCTPS